VPLLFLAERHSLINNQSTGLQIGIRYGKQQRQVLADNTMWIIAGEKVTS